MIAPLLVGSVVSIVSPAGQHFRARYDGPADLPPFGRQQQLTVLDEVPGIFPEFGTTYAATVFRHGFTIQSQEAA